MPYSLITAPNDILKTPCDPVLPHEDVSEICKAMIDICRGALRGVGLAAPQIGVTKRIILIMPTGGGTIIINPVMTWMSPEMQTDREGCLSYPYVYTDVSRHRSVHIKGESIDRLPIKLKFRSFDARIVQHEIEHLDGRCQIEKAWIEAGSPQRPPVSDTVAQREAAAIIGAFGASIRALPPIR